MSDADLLDVPNVGKGVVESIREIGSTGCMQAFVELLAITPPGIVEILQIKGLGPKKVGIIWNTLQIESVADLLDACRQNRLVEVKGFGLKTQAEIVRNIEFSLTAQGKWHYARLWEPATAFLEGIKKEFPEAQVSFTGAFRRAAVVLETIEIICDLDPDEVLEYCDGNGIPAQLNDAEVEATLNGQYPILVFCTDAESFTRELFETTGNTAHLKALQYQRSENFVNEESYYSTKGYRWIPPEQREGLD